MAALAACPCCAVVHLDQVTPVDTFFCERGVLELMVEWREKEGNAKKPHGAMFPCGRSDVTRVGGECVQGGGGVQHRGGAVPHLHGDGPLLPRHGSLPDTGQENL